MQNLDLPALLAFAAALGWASGLKLYLVLLLTGLAGFMNWFNLPPSLSILASPAVLGASGFMVFVEFFADKIPGLDSLWDMLHTVLRIPAGAALAAGAVAQAGGDNAAVPLIAAIIGGTLAATSHATKTATRAAINTSPEPFSNIGASLAEESAVVGGFWLALAQPWVFGGVLLLVLLLSIYLLLKCLRYLTAIMGRVRKLFT